MNDLISDMEQLAQFCAQADAKAGPKALVPELGKLLPELEFDHVLTRGGWHRLGGVVDADRKLVAEHIDKWAEHEADGDIDELTAKHMDSGYFATRLAGKTHYFTAPVGESAEDFVQLEIEELQAVLDRPLFEADWYPDSLEDFIDPLDRERLDPDPVGEPSYLFRRITPIAKMLSEAPRGNQALHNLHRFFEDWRHSSAGDGTPCCRHWALALSEYMDSDGERRLTAKPVATFVEDMPELPPGDELQGVELANTLHRYDRHMGYAFAWYFNMLASKASNFALAEAVLRDQMEAYDYLPAKDLKVLRAWEERPYGV